MYRLLLAMGAGSTARGDSRSGAHQCQRLISYAEEAMRWVRQSKTKNEKQVLIELARTWTQAAAESERSVAVNYRAM